VRAPRILILSASIGEGHDLPARVLADDLRERAPAAEVSVVDGLRAVGGFVEWAIMSGSPFHSKWGNRIFDLEFWLIMRFASVRRLGTALARALGGRKLLAAIAQRSPDVIVSTYPGLTELLGYMRRRGELDVPVVSAITDLASLRFWAHPDIDLHLLTHPESLAEVHELAAGVPAVPVRGLNSPRFVNPPERTVARAALDLPDDRPVAVVSGGGWAVGDLAGAVDVVLGIDDAIAIVICGRNEEVRAGLAARFAGSERVRLLGFTDSMPELLCAADALVHSTAGLTVLEANVCGCPAISYGWGRAHIRANNRAFLRFGLADVAADAPELTAALRRALARPRAPYGAFAQLPLAASVILERFALADGARAEHVGDRD
jgi:UDP-N-acetylglucosamine:LPS N-acetylglucosamine transferase